MESRNPSIAPSGQTAVDPQGDVVNPSRRSSMAAVQKEQRVTLAACFLGLVASVGGFMFGYVSGQISGFFLMDDFLERFGELGSDGQRFFSPARQGTIVGLLPVGCLFGCLIAGKLCDVIGRRLTISSAALFSCVGIIIQISSSTSWAQFAVGRLVDGLGIGALSVAVPMYQSESSPALIRGVVVSMYQLFVTLGIWVSNMVNFGTNGISNSASWRIPNGLGFAWALILGGGILLLPESPRFAFLHGREEEARQTIARLAGVDAHAASVNVEIEEIRQKVEEMKEGADAKWYEIFTGPRMLYRLMLGILLQSGQQLTGANFFFYYGTTVFQATGLDDSYVTQVILGSVNVACTFGGLVVVKKCGRRWALIVGALWMMMCFLVYAFVGHYKLDSVDPTKTPQAGAILVAFSCLFIAGFATTWGPRKSSFPLWSKSFGTFLLTKFRSCLGCRRRAVPRPLPLDRHGNRHVVQLAVELPHLLLHTLHRRRDQLVLRPRLCRLLRCSGRAGILHPQ